MKRRRIENQFKEGIISPPALSKLVIPLSPTENNKLLFSVPSTDPTKNINYTVKIHSVQTTLNSRLQYECECRSYSGSPGLCKHVRSVLIYMMNDAIKTQNQSETINDSFIDGIIDTLDSLFITK